MNVRVGDIIKLENNQFVAVSLVLEQRGACRGKASTMGSHRLRGHPVPGKGKGLASSIQPRTQGPLPHTTLREVPAGAAIWGPRSQLSPGPAFPPDRPIFCFSPAASPTDCAT